VESSTLAEVATRGYIPTKMDDNNTSLSTMSSGIKQSTLMWSMLTRTNYSERAMLMQCNFEAMEIW
jgi:hypothetical protein